LQVRGHRTEAAENRSKPTHNKYSTALLVVGVTDMPNIWKNVSFALTAMIVGSLLSSPPEPERVARFIAQS